MEIIVTDAAQAFMHRMVRMGGDSPEAGFRLSVAPGGCAGVVSEFDVVNGPLAGDAVLEFNALRIFLPQATCTMLSGATVDFHEGAQASGLRIERPNMGDCGCGSTTPGRGGRHATISVSMIRRVP